MSIGLRATLTTPEVICLSIMIFYLEGEKKILKFIATARKRRTLVLAEECQSTETPGFITGE
jgi:hypothetical protein